MINGFLFSIGFTVGFFITGLFLLVILVKFVKANKRYKKEELLIAFMEYLESIKSNEMYEGVDEVNAIIQGLENGVYAEEIKNYEIKSDAELKMSNVYNDTSFRLTNVLKVVKRK